ncbi:hypothetical protein [Methanobrevibacter sp.]|uniref:hypothetical protein n=1 Tax=Methanobrevibacter sp. TaxID=66852 RepID=UPI00386903B2
MSDSRLEKFIYAICSMDVSDLPVPLSRIEKLWKCLITGETPDFEPLSRNEKYLMAMLDRYDISNLPAPMSRGEKLLYKIAVGETDLSDVPGYLSRYEELLKYLIENGEISEDDFEYVLYTSNQSLHTLYLTAEKPVKSAILKGNTIINLVNNFTFGTGVEETDNYFTLTQTNTAENIRVNIETSLIELNKDYTLIYFIQEKTTTASTSLVIKQASYFAPSGNATITQNIGWNKIKFNLSSFGSNRVLDIAIASSEQDGNYIKFAKNKFALLAGDWTNKNIPFNTVKYGMQSVKMPVLTTTGKNLIDDISWESGRFDNNTGLELTDNSFMRYQKFIPVKPSTTYVLSNGLTDYKAIYEYDTQKTFIGLYQNASFPNRSVKFTTSSTTRYIRIWTKNTTISPTFQFEESSTTTTYEPHKSNILTVNEPIELRGIGSVQDTLDLLTGEVTERIGEIVLDGTQNGVYDHAADESKNILILRLNKIPDIKNDGSNLYGLVSDKYNSTTNKSPNNIIAYNTRIMITKPLSELELFNTSDKIKSFLAKNPITLQYPLATEFIKTIDISTVDQDNQPTQLGTFENVTHVSLEAENLVPEVEMEVATRISTELASANPLMDDISTEQQQLNETVNEQSNNVDATMIAATEIFEEIL